MHLRENSNTKLKNKVVTKQQKQPQSKELVGCTAMQEKIKMFFNNHYLERNRGKYWTHTISGYLKNVYHHALESSK